MKQATAFILFFVIFLQIFSKIWIVVCFRIEQDTIAKTLCVKKEVENNTCQGKCHLKKQLNETGQEEQKQVLSNQKGKVEILYFHSQFSPNASKKIVFYEKQPLNPYKPNFYLSSFSKDIFQPPKLNLI